MIRYTDSETKLIARGALAPPIICLQQGIDAGEPYVKLWSDAQHEIAASLAEPDHIYVLANAAFDFGCILNMRPDLLPHVLRAYDDGRVIDVLIDGKLLDIAAGRYDQAKIKGWNLEALAGRVGVVLDKSDTWRTRFASLDGVPIQYWPDGATGYALLDITATRAVHIPQLAAAAEWRAHGVEVLGKHSRQNAFAAFGLHIASCWGVLTDELRTRHLAERIEGYLRGVRQHLIDLDLVRDNAKGSRDTKAAARLMVASCVAAGREVTLTDGGVKDLEAAAEARAKVLALAAEPAEADHVYRMALLSDKQAARADRAWKCGGYLTEGRKNERVTYQDILSESLAATPQGVIPLSGVKLDKDCAILSGNEDLYLYAEYAGANLVRGRCERLMQGFQLPLQTRFDVLKETSRTSSTQPQEPLVGEQMQNFPRLNALTRVEAEMEKKFGKDASVPLLIGLREAFSPRPGNLFIGADYGMAELCSVAQLCLTMFGHSKLAELLNAGVDVHLWLAAHTLNKTYEECYALKDFYDQDRQRCKPANFGFWGGMGPDKFILYSRKQFGIIFTPEEAKRLKAVWRAAFPETGPYFARISALLGDRKSFTYVHPITGFVRGGCGYADGANFGFQHLTAVGAKDAIIAVTIAMCDPRSALYGFRMWNFVHDEILMEGPAARAPEAAVELARIMEREFNKYHPDVPCKAEEFVTPIWSKKTKSKKDEKGLPKVWNPLLPQGLELAA